MISIEMVIDILLKTIWKLFYSLTSPRLRNWAGWVSCVSCTLLLSPKAVVILKGERMVFGYIPCGNWLFWRHRSSWLAPGSYLRGIWLVLTVSPQSQVPTYGTATWVYYRGWPHNGPGCSPENTGSHNSTKDRRTKMSFECHAFYKSANLAMSEGPS